ncbi:MAG: ABC transporter permease, partial [Planctomycetaceae bacterium]|nr:ABC transporter permease [Planctomycetaceae bacterium]
EVDLPQPAMLQLLSRFELGEYELGRRRISHLSGGELRRLNTACEIAAEPKLLFVDEPDSGLDRNNRIQLMRILKGLSLQGCTVVMVTHSDDGLELAGRFWELDRSGLVFDGNWTEYAFRNQRLTTPVRNEILRLRGAPRVIPQTPPDETSPSSPRALPDPFPPPKSSPPTQRQGTRSFRRKPDASQLAALWKREWALVRSQWVFKMIGTLGVATMFAVSLGVSLPADRPYLLAFLAIISVIWMGSTLSLLSICGEREILDHEQSLFLRTDRYLLAKAGVLGILSTLQTAVFLAILTAIRASLLVRSDQTAQFEIEGRLFYQDGIPVFIVAGWCGVMLGLILSALVGTRKDLANRLLPAVILLQIVCSVPIAPSMMLIATCAFGELPSCVGC